MLLYGRAGRLWLRTCALAQMTLEILDIYRRDLPVFMRAVSVCANRLRHPATTTRHACEAILSPQTDNFFNTARMPA